MTMKAIFKPLLFLLTVLVLHSAEATVQKEGNPYTVKSGDTLYDIAQLIMVTATDGKRLRKPTV